MQDKDPSDVKTASFQARVNRMEEFQKKGEDINKSLNDCRRRLAETQKKLQQLSVASSDDAKAELSKVQAEEKKLKKEERDWSKKMEEHRREEKKMPWNVDTLSKEGFSKVTPISHAVVPTKQSKQYAISFVFSFS